MKHVICVAALWKKCGRILCTSNILILPSQKAIVSSSQIFQNKKVECFWLADQQTLNLHFFCRATPTHIQPPHKMANCKNPKWFCSQISMENKKDHNIPKNSCISFAERPHTHKTPSPAVNHTQEASSSAGEGEIGKRITGKSGKVSKGNQKKSQKESGNKMRQKLGKECHIKIISVVGTKGRMLG